MLSTYYLGVKEKVSSVWITGNGRCIAQETENHYSASTDDSAKTVCGFNENVTIFY